MFAARLLRRLCLDVHCSCFLQDYWEDYVWMFIVHAFCKTTEKTMSGCSLFMFSARLLRRLCLHGCLLFMFAADSLLLPGVIFFKEYFHATSPYNECFYYYTTDGVAAVLGFSWKKLFVSCIRFVTCLIQVLLCILHVNALLSQRCHCKRMPVCFFGSTCRISRQLYAGRCVWKLSPPFYSNFVKSRLIHTPLDTASSLSWPRTKD